MWRRNVCRDASLRPERLSPRRPPPRRPPPRRPPPRRPPPRRPPPRRPPPRRPPPRRPPPRRPPHRRRLSRSPLRRRLLSRSPSHRRLLRARPRSTPSELLTIGPRRRRYTGTKMGAMATILAYAAAALVALWRVAHAIPTRQVLAGFVPITRDNRRVILQEWLAEASTRPRPAVARQPHGRP